jgi:hypothetical protein
MSKILAAARKRNLEGYKILMTGAHRISDDTDDFMRRVHKALATVGSEEVQDAKLEGTPQP